MKFNKNSPSKIKDEVKNNDINEISKETLNTDSSLNSMQKNASLKKNNNLDDNGNTEKRFFKGLQALRNLRKEHTDNNELSEELDYDKLSTTDDFPYKKNGKKKILLNGIFSNNPVFRLVLGTCPTLAVTTLAVNGLTMGLAVTFVLICSNLLISLLKNVIPDKIRIAVYITIIATFVSVVEMVMKIYIPSLYESLGLFIPLIAVNCIILARAEAFASTNTLFDSSLDGLGMGLGFTLSLTLIGIVRELLGAGSFFGMKIPFVSNYAMTFFILPAGGFLIFGILMASVAAITAKIQNKKEMSLLSK